MTPHQLYPPNQSNPIQHRGKEKIGGKDGSWQVTEWDLAGRMGVSS